MRFSALLLLCAAAACAQDPFEIQIFEYEPLPRGAYTWEAHLNYVLKGTNDYVGSVAPTEHQLHMSSEFTAGITDEIRAAVTVLTVERPDHSWDYAGIRVLPHFYAPQSWHLPLNLGMIVELSFQSTTYEENSRELEIHTIVEKHLGRLELDGNPAFARALKGLDSRDGWVFEPAGRIGWQLSRSFTPSVEYYSSWGPVQKLLPLADQIHQIFAGGDWRFGRRLTWSFGVGFGMTSTGSGLILKSRFELPFGKKTP